MAMRIVKAIVALLIIASMINAMIERPEIASEYLQILIGAPIGCWVIWRIWTARKRPVTEWTLAGGRIMGAYAPLLLTALIVGSPGQLGTALGMGLTGGLFAGAAVAFLVGAVRGRPVRRCPFCAEVVRPEAVVCKHCGRHLPAASSATTVGA